MTSVKLTSAAEIRPYFAPGSVMVKNLRAARRAQRVGGLVQARVGERERRDQDHQRVREDREALRDDDAGRAVDALEAEPAEQALAAPWLPNQ